MRFTHFRGIIPALMLAAIPMVSSAGVAIGISVNIAPPALPVYVQPPCPAVGYIWTPGYWAWDDGDYYWVPGTWVMAPAVGLLWTPGYWGWAGGAYAWHAGYWGPHIGFYGGVNYGFGYTGVGYAGGYWHGGAFYYNRSVSNVTNVNVTNVYNKTVVNNVTVNHVSYNGGTGGIQARPTPAQMTAEHEHHVGFTPMQHQQEQMAAHNQSLRASVNGGRPSIAATARPGEFSGHGVVAARAAGGPVHSAGNEHQNAMHTDRPQWAQGAGSHPGVANSPHNEMRNDRPPSAQQGHPGSPHPGPQVAHAPAMNGRPPNQHAMNQQYAQHNAAPRPQPQMHEAPRAQPQMHEAPRPHEAAAPRSAAPNGNNRQEPGRRS